MKHFIITTGKAFQCEFTKEKGMLLTSSILMFQKFLFFEYSDLLIFEGVEIELFDEEFNKIRFIQLSPNSIDSINNNSVDEHSNNLKILLT